MLTRPSHDVPFRLQEGGEFWKVWGTLFLLPVFAEEQTFSLGWDPEDLYVPSKQKAFDNYQPDVFSFTYFLRAEQDRITQKLLDVYNGFSVFYQIC